MVNLLYPQEIAVHYILPAIRRALAIEFKSQGMDQKNIAKLLHVTEGAISQYINSKRAAQVPFTKKLQSEVSVAAAHIKSRPLTLLPEIHRLVTLALHERVTCEVHCRLSTEVTSACEVCFHA